MFATKVDSTKILIPRQSLYKCWRGVGKRIDKERYVKKKMAGAQNPDQNFLQAQDDKIAKLKIIRSELKDLLDKL